MRFLALHLDIRRWSASVVMRSSYCPGLPVSPAPGDLCVAPPSFGVAGFPGAYAACSAAAETDSNSRRCPIMMADTSLAVRDSLILVSVFPR